MKYMREKHPDVSKQQYELTLVNPQQNNEQDDEAPESEDKLLTSIMCE